MTKEDFDIYQKLIECKNTGNKVKYDDLNHIWNTFISRATLCRSCSSMMSNAYSKIIRYFEKNKSLIPVFDKPNEHDGTTILTKIEENIMNMIVEPTYDEKVPENEEKAVEKVACLTCSTIFERKKHNQLYCSLKCRDKMRDLRIIDRQKRNKLK
jgi:hypothetical protein